MQPRKLSPSSLIMFVWLNALPHVVSQGWKPAWAAGFLLLCSLPMGGLNRNLHGMSPCWDVPSPVPPQSRQVWGLSALCGWGQQHLSTCCSSCWTAQCLPLGQTNPKSCWEGPGRERTGFLQHPWAMSISWEPVPDTLAASLKLWCAWLSYFTIRNKYSDFWLCVVVSVLEVVEEVG